MALSETGIDFSSEDWDTATEFYDGCWAIADRHCPSLNRAMEVNNRTFIFRLKSKGGDDVLLAFGCGGGKTIDVVKRLEKDTGAKLGWVLGNGGGHHLFLGLWYEAFPEARILVPSKRVPSTENGQKLKAKYPDRWELMEGPKPSQISDEFGDQVDIVIFDQLFAYKDEVSRATGGAADHSSEPTNLGGFGLMKMFGKLMKDTSQPNDEVFFFHRKSGLVIAGHNYQFSYTPKGYKPPEKFKLKMGGFPLSLMMKMMMPKGAFKSTLEGQPGPVADSKVHAEEWEAVLAWDIKAWTTSHDPPTICGPDMSGDEIKAAVRESLARSGEDDPTGARLKWNVKHK
jgi:hypothetical protein